MLFLFLIFSLCIFQSKNSSDDISHILIEFQDKDPKLQEFRNNAEIDFFQSFSKEPFFMNLHFIPVAVNRGETMTNGNVKIRMFGEDLNGYCDQNRIVVQTLIEKITECSSQDIEKYVYNYIISNGQSDPNSKVGKELEKYKSHPTWWEKVKEFQYHFDILFIKRSDKQSYFKAAENTVSIRKIIYQDYVEPQLSQLKDLYNFQMKESIVEFEYNLGKKSPIFTDIHEIEPKDINQQLFFNCYKMGSCFSRGMNSYELRHAMDCFNKKHQNIVKEYNLERMVEYQLKAADIRNIELNFQKFLMSNQIEPDEMINEYRKYAYFLFNRANLGYGPGSLEKVNVFGANLFPNTCSKSKDHFTFLFDTLNENFLIYMESRIKANTQLINGPDFSKTNFSTEYEYIYKKHQSFIQERNEESEQVNDKYNNAVKEIEKSLKKTSILKFKFGANLEKVKSMVESVNNMPFSFSISNSKATVKLGPFSVSVNIGVIAVLYQNFMDLKLLTQKKQRNDKIMNTIYDQNCLITLYYNAMEYKNEPENIGFEVQIFDSPKHIQVTKIRNPQI